MDTWLLVNIVHNDFKRPDAIFEPFLKAGAAFAAAREAKQQTPYIMRNGHPNGKANGNAY